MGDFQEIEMDPVVAREPAKDNPRVEPKASRFDSAQASVVRSALETAQNWFERNAPWRIVANHVSLHFQEAVSLISRSKPSLESAGQLDATYRAMDAYILRVAPQLQGDEADTFRHEFKAIRSVADNLRRVLGMPKLPSKKSGRSASKSNDTYEAAALEATLDLVLLEATMTTNKVSAASESQYIPAIINAASRLHRDLNYAVEMLNAYGGADRARRFGKQAGAVGLALAQLQRFINDRQNRKQMVDAFGAVESKADELMEGVKLPAISSIELKTSNKRDDLKEGASIELTTARSALGSSFSSLQTKVAEGAFLFYELAVKQDEPDEASLWTDLVKGLLIALVGNALGPGVGTLATRAGLVAAEGAGINFVANAATDAIQAWAGPIIDAAKGQTKNDADKKKAALYFKTSVVLASDEVRRRIEKDFDRRISDHSINAQEIRDAESKVSNEVPGAEIRTFHHAARDFALMLAQQSLGVDESPGQPTSKKTTRIGKDYEHHRGWTDGQKSRAEGIARLSVTVGADGYSIERYELVGLNKEMAKAVLDGAQGKLGSLGLPTEISITTKGHGYPEMLVVDEKTTIRYSTSWNLFRQSPASARFDSPDKAWKELRNAVIPSDLVSIK